MPTLFADIPTDDLRKLRNDLRSHIPGDATHVAAVSRLLGHLVNFDLAHPERAERDEAAKQAAEAEAMKNEDRPDTSTDAQGVSLLERAHVGGELRGGIDNGHHAASLNLRNG